MALRALPQLLIVKGDVNERAAQVLIDHCQLDVGLKVGVCATPPLYRRPTLLAKENAAARPSRFQVALFQNVLQGERVAIEARRARLPVHAAKVSHQQPGIEIRTI
jgi:hypothetical protein